MDLDHRPLGYEGNAAEDNVQAVQSNLNKTLVQPRLSLLSCTASHPVHGQNADNFTPHTTSLPGEFFWPTKWDEEPRSSSDLALRQAGHSG